MTEEKQKILQGRMKPGDTLVVAGSIGQNGVRTLLAKRREWFSPWFSPGYLEWIEEDREPCPKEMVLQMAEFSVTGVQDVEEGGILRAVWELSGEYGVGVSFDLHRIPIKQYTIEVCERCGANPYRLWCGNCLLLASKKGWQLAEALLMAGIEAAVIGQVEEGIARKIVHGEDMGFLERPKEDELFRLLGQEAVKPIWGNRN